MGLYIRTLESFSLSLLALLMLDERSTVGDNKWPTLPHTIPTTSSVCLVQLPHQLEAHLKLGVWTLC